MSIFTSSEMIRIRNNKENPLQWANDYLYYHILDEVQKNKNAIIDMLSTTKNAVLFRYKDVDWNLTKKQEKELLRDAPDLDRWAFCVQKETKQTEIEDKCYKHYLTCGSANASIRSILNHTDVMTRLRVAFGPDFDVVETRRMAPNSPRINFRDNRPSYMFLDCTIEIDYKPKRKTAEQRVEEYYRDYRPSVYNLYDVLLVNQPVARHLVFEDI